jgi:multicomponent Na+:H+ antiporter subunit G
MQLALDILSWISIGLGGIFVVIGGIGLVRMPDFYTRLHPAGITDTLGAALILLGLLLQAGFTITAAKIVIIFLFLMITSPTASHATARAALADGLKPLLYGKRGKQSKKSGTRAAADNSSQDGPKKGGAGQ